MVKMLDVAAAVIERPDGTYLLGRRAPGTFYPGYWEFPGGKVEAGETPRDAVVRELQEELGITVHRADPWLRRTHVYEHAHVNLHFFRVREWSGEVSDHVHDALSWQRPGDEQVAPMLPANGPVLAALAMPEYYAITHASEIGVEQQLAQLRRALASGSRLVQLREPALVAETRVSFYREAVALCHTFGARTLIHEDVALAQSLGADGVHLPARALASLSERPSLPLVAASCHDAAELSTAAILGCDFAVLSPVLPTQSHPGSATLGWEGFAQECAVTSEGHLRLGSLPIPPLLTFALGGVGPGDLDAARRHGAHGVAGIRAFW
jgi:8-oxo-dGTP diphosphatase